MKKKYSEQELAFLNKVLESPGCHIPDYSYDWVEVDGEQKARALWVGLQSSGVIAQTGVYAWEPTEKAREILQA
jgi:hypothetical protein